VTGPSAVATVGPAGAIGTVCDGPGDAVAIASDTVRSPKRDGFLSAITPRSPKIDIIVQVQRFRGPLNRENGEARDGGQMPVGYRSIPKMIWVVTIHRAEFAPSIAPGDERREASDYLSVGREIGVQCLEYVAGDRRRILPHCWSVMARHFELRRVGASGNVLFDYRVGPGASGIVPS